MLNIFPELLFLAPASALLIRASVAIIFALSAHTHWKSRAQNTRTFSLFALVELVVAALLAIGLYTQPVAVAGALIAFAWIWRRPMRPFSLSTILLTIALCASLILTGAGPVSFDLPL